MEQADQPTRRITRSQYSEKTTTTEKLHKTNGHQNSFANGTLNGSAKFSEKVTAESFLSSVLIRLLMPIFLMIFSPNLVILLWYTATKCNGSIITLLQVLSQDGILEGVKKVWADVNIASELAVVVLIAYSVIAIILHICVPGPRAEGPVTPKGNIPVYKDNGFYCYLITVATFFAVTFGLKQFGLTPTIVFDRFDEFLGTLTVFSFIICAFLYIKGLTSPSSGDYGSSGNPIFDFYWGTELYPRIFGVDVKVFTNCRFGMTVWPLLCLIFTLKSYELHGFVDSIWVSCFLQMVYFTKFFWWESGYMRTIDIMVDRAGFYICWGCLVYVPGLYASVCMFMVNHPVKLGPVLSAIILSCGLLSVFINFWADKQKLMVRNTNAQCIIWGKTPEIIRAKYRLETGEIRESILLVSGFWGVARHFHYIPELLLAFCWSIPILLESMMCYTYFIWLILLLTHRTFRDDTKCGEKYGSYWKDYCKRVPYKMIPGIF